MTEETPREQLNLLSHNVSRRLFLKTGLTGLLAAAVGSIVKSKINSGSRSNPHTETPIETAILKTPEYQCVNLDGIDIYGTNEAISSTTELQQLTDQINDQFLIDNGLKPEPQLNEFEVRQKLLDESERYLQVIVKKALFDNFESQNTTKDGIEVKTDFINWIKDHMEIFNNFTSQGEPKTDLKAKIKRIIVVHDDFDDRFPSHQNVAITTLDTDAQWAFFWDVRGDVDPTTNESQALSFLRPTFVNGRIVTIDYGVIHEWTHMLYNLPDQYIFNSEKFSYSPVDLIPPFLMSQGGMMYDRSPWFYYALKYIRDNNIRGYYTDERAMGIIGQSSLKEDQTTVLDIFKQHPKTNRFVIKDADDQLLEAQITVLKSRNDRDGNYYNPKNFEPCYNGQVINGVFELDADIFASFGAVDFAGRSVIQWPTNFVFEITTSKGDKAILHFPVVIFNIASLAGLDEASYSLQLLNTDATSSTNQQVMQMSEFTPEQMNIHYPYEAVNIPYAQLDIDNIPVSFHWIMADPKIGEIQDRSLFGY